MTEPITLTLGERYHNPGDVEWFDIPWHGLLGRGDGNLCIFDTDFHGIRALALDLLNQQRRHGLRTIADIIAKFAPAKDRNNVPAYIDAMCHAMTCSATYTLDLADRPTLMAFTTGIIVHEQGRCIYAPAVIAAPVSAVLGLPPI